jgi:hypothetical protein
MGVVCFPGDSGRKLKKLQWIFLRNDKTKRFGTPVFAFLNGSGCIPIFLRTAFSLETRERAFAICPYSPILGRNALQADLKKVTVRVVMMVREDDD